jgi:hypothetical protein
MENVNVNVDKFKEVKYFLESNIGKVMVLHMSMGSTRHKTTDVITSGIIDSVIFHDGNGMYNEGFQVQLKGRNGKLYGNTENFFGTFNFESFDSFEKIEKRSLSDAMYIRYKDNSFFVIEIRI